jgi:hypothetical protein
LHLLYFLTVDGTKNADCFGIANFRKGYLMNYYRASLLSLLLLMSVIGLAYPQGEGSIDWRLSSLRGLWEYHTYNNRWTFLFESDSQLLMDRKLKEYLLLPNVIQIKEETAIIDYPYKLDNDNLTITYPDGNTITLKYKDQNEAEQEVVGKFYNYIDSTSSHQSISLRENSVFYDGTSSLGLYRVEQDAVIITQNDGTIVEAEIRYRDNDGNVTGIIYNDKLYDKDHYADYVPTVPTPGVAPLPIPYPPAPGPCLCGLPLPPISPGPTPQTPAPQTKPSNDDGSTVRGFGSTHEGSGRSGVRP